MRVRTTFLVLLAVGLVSACQVVVDPATGETHTLWTVPGFQGNAVAAQNAWNNCVQFRSQSYCERNLPGGRPTGVPPLFPTPELTARDSDP